MGGGREHADASDSLKAEEEAEEMMSYRAA